MRVAVLVSGAFRTKAKGGDLVNSHNVLTEKFPDADFYYATWSSYKDDFENLFPNESCLFIDELEPAYHPYFDMDPENYPCEQYKLLMKRRFRNDADVEWSRHHCKQIIIHAELLNSLPKEYDECDFLYVEVPYDLYIDPEADFSPYVEDTFENNRVNCFAYRNSKNMSEATRTSSSNKFEFPDVLIIHPGDALQYDNVMELYDNQKLLAAEYGWAQVLSKDSGYNQRSFAGYASTDHQILNKFRRERMKNKK